MHPADSASDEFDHELALSQLSAEQDALYEVEAAMKRITNGGYGVCEQTAKRIPAARLKAVPWTRFREDLEERLESTHVMHVVGDVRDKACLIIDDMISTGGTIAGAIAALLAAGARAEIFIAATYGLLLRGAWEKLNHPAVREVLVTDTLAVAHPWPLLRIVSVAPLLADTIRRVACQTK